MLAIVVWCWRVERSPIFMSRDLQKRPSSYIRWSSA
jgi:hypothetical protein